MQKEIREQSKKLGLKSLILLLWQNKILIVLVTLLFSALGVGYAISQPNKYKAEVMLIPAEQAQGGGLGALASQFGGLAGMAGINLSGGASKKPKIALQILQSKHFLIDFIQRNKLKVSIFAATDWDAVQDQLIINEKLYDVVNEKWVRKFKFPRTQVPSDQEVLAKLYKMMSLFIDHREGTYRIEIEHFSPNLAASWANMLASDINEHMRALDIKQAKNSIEYLQEKLINTEQVEIRNVFNGLVQEQIKTAMLAEVQEDYVFVVVDKALAPEKKSQPKRALICIFAFIFGGIFSCAIVLLRFFFTESKVNT